MISIRKWLRRQHRDRNIVIVLLLLYAAVFLAVWLGWL